MTGTTTRRKDGNSARWERRTGSDTGSGFQQGQQPLAHQASPGELAQDPASQTMVPVGLEDREDALCGLRQRVVEVDVADIALTRPPEGPDLAAEYREPGQPGLEDRNAESFGATRDEQRVGRAEQLRHRRLVKAACFWIEPMEEMDSLFHPKRATPGAQFRQI